MQSEQVYLLETKIFCAFLDIEGKQTIPKKTCSSKKDQKRFKQYFVWRHERSSSVLDILLRKFCVIGIYPLHYIRYRSHDIVRISLPQADRAHTKSVVIHAPLLSVFFWVKSISSRWGIIR